jgi:hypothetical protein
MEDVCAGGGYSEDRRNHLCTHLAMDTFLSPAWGVLPVLKLGSRALPEGAA